MTRQWSNGLGTCALLLAFAGLAVLMTFSAAEAGIYKFSCDAVGSKKYVYDPTAERLSLANSEKPIPHKMGRRRRFRELIGNCVSGSDLFRFRQEVFGIALSFQAEGKAQKQKFVCTRIQYTTPEGRTCDREVRRSNWNAPEKYYRAFVRPEAMAPKSAKAKAAPTKPTAPEALKRKLKTQ